jgi:hypothetical protein
MYKCTLYDTTRFKGVIGGGSLQMVSEPLPSLRWWERAQAQRGLPAGTRWDAKNGGIP